MPNYSKVQFIAWEIYTGPVYQNRLADHYPGIAPALADRPWAVLSQCLDISARVQFTKKALDAAYESADQDENTLKVFMAPEFLYRGAAGAYLFDLLNGWEEDAPSGFGNLPQPYGHHWGGLWGELRALAAEEKFQHWVSVFGTAVGAALPCSQGQIHMRATGPAAGWNLSLVQCGGIEAEQRDACYFVEKHLKSGIDFINFNLSHAGSRVFTTTEIAHGSEPTWMILDRLIQAAPGETGGSLFQFPHICKSSGEAVQFGLEICLDHAQAYTAGARETQVTGRLARGGAQVDIQLVPSCGMSLLESSLALAPKDGPKDHAYAFNCDGLNGWASAGGSIQWFLGGHIQLWSGSPEPGLDHPPQHLAEVTDSFRTDSHTPVSGSADLSSVPLTDATLRSLHIDLSNIPSSRLWHSHAPFAPGRNSYQHFWPEGAGFVRVLPPQPLAPTPAPVSEPKKDHRSEMGKPAKAQNGDE